MQQLQNKKLVYLVAALLSVCNAGAQICTNNTDSVYGLLSLTAAGSGQIVGINILNGGTATIGSPAATSANANGLGFSSMNGNFYFFNQCGSGTTEFVSFDPFSGLKVSLAIPSTPAIPVTQKLRSGTMNPSGLGYYTIHPGANMAQGYPVTGPALFYYSVGANAWTLITQSFLDISGNSVNEIRTYNSGDMAFDGSGNLWILSSNASNYALYRINAPVPTTAVASVTVDTVIAARPTPAGVSFTGIAFNASGHLYLSTGSYTTPPGVAGNNQLYEMTSPVLPLTNIATLTNGYGDDLTSCATPTLVLPVQQLQVTALQVKNKVQIGWKSSNETGVYKYQVQHSRDALNWQTVNETTAGKAFKNTDGFYSFLHGNYAAGTNYYRIAQLSAAGNTHYSAIKKLVAKSSLSVSISPNPASNIVMLNFQNNTAGTVFTGYLYDYTGRRLLTQPLTISTATINISSFSKGQYVLQVVNNQQQTVEVIKFTKQ
jgi:hypothetical protein